MADTLLPPSATQQERSLEAAIARAFEFSPDFARNWNPGTVPANILPWLAWAYSVDNWGAEWPEDVKRAFTEQSYFIHRHKGTVGAVRRALQSVTGGDFELAEWFQTGGPVHTFDLTVWAHNILFRNGPLLSEELYNQIIQVVDAAKPVRSHYGLRVGAKLKSEASLTGVASAVSSARLPSVMPTPRSRFNGQTAILAANAMQATGLLTAEAAPMPRSRYNLEASAAFAAATSGVQLASFDSTPVPRVKFTATSITRCAAALDSFQVCEVCAKPALQAKRLSSVKTIAASITITAYI